MDIQVSLKVRSAIKAKLVELGLHVDEELPDYVMVLIANKRSKVQIEHDLELFLGENTIKFTSWLQHVLEKLEEITGTGTPSVTAAAKEKDIKKKKGDSDEKKKKKDDAKAKDKKVKDKAKEKENSSETGLESSTPTTSTSQTNEKEPKKRSNSTSSKSSKSDQKSEKRTVWMDCTFQVVVPPKKNESESESKETTVSKNSKETKDKLAVKRKIEEPEKSTKEMKSTVGAMITHAKHHRSDEERDIGNNLPSVKKSNNSISWKPSKSDPKPEKRPARMYSRFPVDVSIPRRKENESEFKEKSSNKPPAVKFGIKRHFEEEEVKEVKSAKEVKPVKEVRTMNEVKPVKEAKSTREVKSTVELKSTVGAMIRHAKLYDSDEERDTGNKLASVVHVTARPKREKEPSKNLLLRAMADAHKSIKSSRDRSRSRSRSRDRVKRDGIRRRLGDREAESRDRRRHDDELEERRRTRIARHADDLNAGRVRRRLLVNEISIRPRRDVSSRKNNSLLDDNENVLQTQNAQKPRRSVYERLGVKRTNFFDDYGVEHMQKEFASVEELPDYDDQNGSGHDYKDDMIVISVPSTTSAGRNVSLESMKDRPRPRISIQLNDDESTDDDEYDPVKTSLQAKVKSAGTGTTQKISKAESESDYIVEEIEQEETDDENEIEFVIGDTSLKLPEPLDQNESSQSSHQSDPKDASTDHEHEQQQQMQLLSEQELGEVMARGPEIRLPSISKEQETFSEPVADTSAVTTTTTVAVEEKKVPVGSRLGPPPIRVNPVTVTTVQCKYWPECTFKDKCIYTHPKCKFDSKCKNINCIYKHSSPRVRSAPINMQNSKPDNIQQCKFFPNCHSLNCPFFHPTPCKFGLGCNDANCKNFHPGETRGQKARTNISSIVAGLNSKKKSVPAANLLKWTKTKV